MEKKLPKGWVEVNFGSIISVMTNGGNFKQEEHYQEGYRPISRIETIWNETIDTKRVKYALISEFEKQKYKIQIGDILFSHINSDKHLGKTAIYKKDIGLIHGVNLLLLRNFYCIKSDYVNYYLRYFKLSGGFIEIAQRSVNQSSINQKKLGGILFLLPPLAEQERIASKLDELFDRIEVIKASMEKIPQLLKDFRQQVLTSAVTGKLTEEWREGKAFDSRRFFSINELSSKLGSGATPKGGSEVYQNEGIPLVRSMNVVFWGIKKEGLVFISDKQAEALKNVEIKPNDILLNITGASIGRVCIADECVIGGRVNQHVFIIRVKEEKVLPTFLNIYLSSPRIQKFINDENYGVTRQSITKTQIGDILIEIPLLVEQEEIVSRVESLFAKADKIEEQYVSLKKKIDVLPQLLLHKAFKGELVEQLPTDGDAADLLKEIMALKKDGKKKKK